MMELLLGFGVLAVIAFWVVFWLKKLNGLERK